MKKLPLFIIILLALALFGAADYYLNGLDGRVVMDIGAQEVTEAAADIKADESVSSQFQLGQSVAGYTVATQVQTSQLFEKIDLSKIENINIYRHQLEKATEEEGKMIYLYEIRGPKDQGSLTYLNVKLQFIAQINALTETINEDSAFGHNSFYFNDSNYQNTAFLLTQINDNLFGFQYNKADAIAYEDVKSIIASLMPSNNL